jgi:CHAT domain-containing protein
MLIAAGFLLSVAAAAFSALAETEPVTVVAIVPGPPETFQLAVGQTLRHPLTLEAGQFLQVHLREMGPRVVLTLLDQQGSALARRVAPMETMASLRLLAIAGASGAHTLEVRSSGEGRPGTYQIRLEEPRASTDGDRTLVAADEDLAEGARLGNEARAESRKLAVARLDAAEGGFRAGGDRSGQALALLKRGRVQFESGETAASDSIEQSLLLFRELGDREGEGAALHDLAWTRSRQAQFEEARTLFERAADHARAMDARWLLSAAVSGIGMTFDRTGQAERAVELYSEALSLATEAGSPSGRARVLNNLGIAYRLLGEDEKALESYVGSLSLSRAQGRHDHAARTLGNMANAHVDRGEDVEALALAEQALPIARAGGLNEIEARILNVMAKALRHLGEYDRAIELGRKSLEMRRQMRDRVGEALTLHALGRSLHQFGDSEAGLQHLGEALRIQRATRQRYSEAETLGAMATVERDRGNLREALAQAEAAVVLTEELRSALTNPDLRASFVAAELDTYGLYIDVLMRLHAQDPAAGHDTAALQVSERARARVLLDALVEARADIREGVDAALLAEERSLQKRLSQETAQLSRVLERAADPAEVARAQRTLEETSLEYRRVQTQIRRESPRYAALTQPVPATVEQIRREVLDDQTVLLEFYLGEERSTLWAVTRSALSTHDLPARVRIDGAARKVHELLTRRQSTLEPAAVKDADQELQRESLALSRLLLGGIAAQLAGEWKGRRLLIVASGALAYVPFGALPSPFDDTARRPMLLDHEIVFAPSASVLAAVRQEQGPQAETPTTVAVVADPVFDRSDPRVRTRAGAGAQPAPAPMASIGLTRAMGSLGRTRFSRLPFSRQEADAIAALVPRASVLKATDFAASHALVSGGGLGDRRVVHFATHGLLDSEHPDLSGLVLSLVDEKGRTRNGFLRMHEIYNLRLPADLVVLSACQTALGREIRGEGLVGLTRGFMYAGARRVVASLWQVDDESTAELMKHFYRGMLKEGRRPADALRTAQLRMSEDRRWSAPFYWAGFVIQGDWR